MQSLGAPGSLHLAALPCWLADGREGENYAGGFRRPNPQVVHVTPAHIPWPELIT